jgi:hypothetical protein
VTYPRQLGHDDAAELLEETLNEEKETDRKLTELAEGMLNEQAKAGESEGDEEEEEEKPARPRTMAAGAGGARGASNTRGASRGGRR